MAGASASGALGRAALYWQCDRSSGVCSVLDAEGKMPVELAFEEPSTFTVHAAGRVTFEEVEVVLEEMRTHPRLCCGVRVFVDGREVVTAPTTLELRVIAGDLRPLLERGLAPVAIVAGSAFVYGVARMFSVFAEAIGANVHAFRCPDEARQWLTAEA